MVGNWNHARSVQAVGNFHSNKTKTSLSLAEYGEQMRKGSAELIPRCPTSPYIHQLRRSGRSPALPYPPSWHLLLYHISQALIVKVATSPIGGSGRLATRKIADLDPAGKTPTSTWILLVDSALAFSCQALRTRRESPPRMRLALVTGGPRTSGATR